jgi:amino acid transporter
MVIKKMTKKTEKYRKKKKKKKKRRRYFKSRVDILITLTICLFLIFRAVRAAAIATMALILTTNLLFLSYLFVIMALKADSNRNEF